MAQLKVYKLHFTSPLHIGDNKDDYSISLKTISSDTMYAALTSCLAKVGELIPDDGNLGFTISSLFPFYQKDKNDQPIYFFPKPLSVKLPKVKVEDAKKIKKVSWIESSYFNEIINGENFPDNTAEIKGAFLAKGLKNVFIKSQISQRVAVSRSGNEDAMPFYMDRIYFEDYSGLFFIAEGDTSYLEKAMNILKHEGIGTDRNVGNGFFEFDSSKTIEIDIPQNTDLSISLSSFIPENKEQLLSFLNHKNVNYDFQRRGGWITTHPFNSYRKNAIYSFASGSVFNYQSNSISTVGKIVNLKPTLGFEPEINHPIWRNGKSIFLPIKNA